MHPVSEWLLILGFSSFVAVGLFYPIGEVYFPSYGTPHASSSVYDMVTNGKCALDCVDDFYCLHGRLPCSIEYKTDHWLLSWILWWTWIMGVAFCTLVPVLEACLALRRWIAAATAFLVQQRQVALAFASLV